MTADKTLKACVRCSSPFLKQCPAPNVARCESCNYLHVLAPGTVLAEAPVGAVTIIRDHSDKYEGLVLVTRLTRSIVCERWAHRKDLEVLAPDGVEVA